MSLTRKQLQGRAGLRRSTLPPSARDRSALRRQRWAWVYKRLSTHEQTKKSIWGLAMQDELEKLPIDDGYPIQLSTEEVEALRQTADFPGFYVNGQIHVEERDLGISGTKNHQHRPGLAALIAAIRSDQVEAVYVLDIKRLYRDQYLIDAMTFAKLCKDHGVLIVTPVLTYDLTQEIYWEMYEIEVKNAARELKVLRFRLGGAKELKAKHGFWDGRPVCWGYLVDLDPGSPTHQKYVPYPPHQQVLVELFELATKYSTCRSLSLAVRQKHLTFPALPPELHEQHFRLHAMRNCRLQADGSYLPTMTSLVSILTNPTCIGWWSAGDMLLKNNHAPVVPEALFWSVQEIYNPLDFRTGQPNPEWIDHPQRRREPVALLSGLIYCGMHPEDGAQSAHRVQSKGRQQGQSGINRYYGCTGDYDHGRTTQKCLLVSHGPIDQAIAGHVLGCLQLQDLAAEVAAQMNARSAETANLRQASIREARLLRSELDGLKQKLPWVKSEDQYDLVMAEVDRRQSRLQELERQAKAALPEPLKPHQIADVEAFLKTIATHWPRVSLQARSKLLGILLERVTVYHDQTMRLELHLEWRTGVIDVVEALRPLPSRPPDWRWEEWEDAVLRQSYATEPDPQVLISRLKPIRNWASVMERAWRLGLSRPRNLTPWGTGRAAIAPIGARQPMNPTSLKRGTFRHLGRIWDGQFLTSADRSGEGQAEMLLRVSPAVRLLEEHKMDSFSNGFSATSLK